jgi:ribosomal silencing factor RsfS
VALHVAPLVSWTSYMVITTVTSRPQLLAVQYRCSEVAETVLRRTCTEHSQGKPGKSEWELVDFGDVVVSVMTPAQRELCK